MGSIRACAAGAGTGKTYNLCKEIVRRVREEDLDPARVVAMTFTKRAAAELEGRIRAALLEGGDGAPDIATRIGHAERVDLALIGTVHSVGHRIVSRHALHLGLPPTLDVLDESAAPTHMERILGALPSDVWARLAELSRRLAVEEPQREVRRILDVARANRLDPDEVRRDLRASAKRVCDILGRTRDDDASADVNAAPHVNPFPDLYAEASRALDRLMGIDCSTKDTQDCVTKLRRLVNRRSGEWRDFATCADLKAGKRSGADAALADLRSHAIRIRSDHLLHKDLADYGEGLADAVAALDDAWRVYKHARGLLDYTDLEAAFLSLLENDDLASGIGKDFDFVVVDEFQDTSPMQLAIFTRLASVVQASYWVGDKKQAIYGFRGADATLVDGVWNRLPRDALFRLEKNWRSRKGVVDLVGVLFADAFGSEAKLRAQKPGKGCAAERWRLQGRYPRDHKAALVAGVRALIREGARPGDIAILARSGNDVQDLSDGLEAARIPVSVKLPGLLARRECRLAVAGIGVVADRWDGVARAIVRHLTEDSAGNAPAWLLERLDDMRADRDKDSALPRAWPDHVLLTRLERVPETAGPVDALLAVIGTLDLPRRIAQWGDPVARAANLDALLRIAAGYEDAVLRDGGAPTLTGLLEHLRQREAAEDDERPAPRGLDAVHVLTAHAAKGLEWPIVIVYGLAGDKESDPWRIRAEGGDPGGADPLMGRRLVAWPWPFGRNPFGGQLGPGAGLREDAAESREGRMLAQGQAEEELRLLYVAITRAERTFILAQGGKSDAYAERLPRLAELLPDDDEGEHAVAGLDTTYRVRHPAPEDLGFEPRRDVAWVREEDLLHRETAPRWFAPSSVGAPSGIVRFVEEALPAVGGGELGMRGRDADSIGNALHAYLAALPSLVDLDDAHRRAVAERLIRAHGVEGVVEPAAVVAAGERLTRWVAAQGAATWWTEVPVRARRESGGAWMGHVDLVLEFADGRRLLVDHKSVMAGEAAAAHVGQLDAYAQALAAAGVGVDGRIVHLPRGRRVVRL